MMNGALFLASIFSSFEFFNAQVAAKQADGLLEVVDVVGPHGILAIGVLKQFFRRDDHG